ncbi:hypothetical protein QN277_021388 [Acacia crassicarpa]|uniref:Uncharacterized protein n=1 Tax=Acacia crassicarpa TaxID=499986 RepID=A0AAE1JLN3_9FABA|nr:hypothetical protein QN277_021388 [Acacia crassicarpa]
MKLSAKPISSPGRAEKFPPPLMRFLRSNAGSRSRGRSRRSPMFVRRKSTATETQEPSSPKVTCMGQVRVRRSSKQAASKRPRRPGDGATTRCRCRWIRKFLFCHCVATKIKPGPCQPVWPKWGFCRVGSSRRKPTRVREDSHSSQTELNFQDRGSGKSRRDYEELEEEEYEERARVNANDNATSFVSESCTPPKNALLLTRCRSAPYRSSSLANRFWGSPLRSEETEQEQRTELENGEPTESDELTEQSESIDKEPEEKLSLCRELRDSVKERLLKFEDSQEFRRREGGGGDYVHPLVLTRCKSEPARTAQKIDAEVKFWKKRRSGVSDL